MTRSAGRGGDDDSDADVPVTRRTASAEASASAPVAASAAPVVTVANATGFSGSWAAASSNSRANFAGLAPPTRLVIRESKTEVAVETNTGTEGQLLTTVYKLDGTEHPIPGPLGWDTRAIASMRDGALTVVLKRSIDGPTGLIRFEIKDVYTLTDNTLTLERSQGTGTQRLTYSRR